jgi:hypothetical protein
MFNSEQLIFRTNYTDQSGLNNRFADTLKKFDIPNDSAFKIFPRRRTWLGTNTSDGPGYTGYLGGEYDLYETGRIIDTEAYVAISFRKKHNLIFKEGYSITSENEHNLKYVKRRIAEMEYVSNIKFTKFIKEIAMNLVNTHNCYILKIRKNTASSGKQRKWKGVGSKIDPIAGYFVIPSESIEVRTDQYGTVQSYRQNMRGYFLEFEPYDIIQICYNRRTGYTMAAPPLEAVKDDILALRKIEESVESLIYKVLFPIIHVKVGTDQNPAKVLPDGVSEVAVATRLLEQLDDSGGIATSERVSVDLIGAESQALRVESYLKYFKVRVYSGLGMSGLDFGDVEGGGAATAEFLDAALKTSIHAYQGELEDAISRDIFDEILLESGRYEHTFEIDEEDRVNLKFSELDVDNMIKKENHTIQKANVDLITTDEARQQTGKKSMKPGQHDELHNRNMEQRNAKDEHKRQKDLATHQASLVPPTTSTSTTKKATNGASTTTKVTKTGTAKSQPTKKAGAASAAKNKAKPKNQHSKDWLLTRLFLTINNTQDNKEELLSKHFADFLLYNASQGFIDPNEEDALTFKDIKSQAELLTTQLIIDLIDLHDLNIQDPITLNKKKDTLISKTIDKVVEYVNNITSG